MAIPEDQLTTWSHQGSVPQSSSTYAIIKNALEAPDGPYAGKQYTVFLQGSYGNDTNIYAESDVDVVIELTSTFYSDLDELRPEEQAAYHAAYNTAPYQYVEWQRDVLAQLRARFGTAIEPGSKAVNVKAGAGRRSSDVLAAAEFRRYDRFSSIGNESYDEGICFFKKAGTRITNYPRQHSDNCTRKHQATNSRFKPMVRIFKNLRGALVDSGTIADGTAPSYYLEGLLYNVPDELFSGSYQDAFVAVVNWLSAADRSAFVCANEQYYLLREDPDVTWSAGECAAFLNAAVGLWEAW